MKNYFYKTLKLFMISCVFVIVITSFALANDNDKFSENGCFIDVDYSEYLDIAGNVCDAKVFVKMNYAQGDVCIFECADEVEIDGETYFDEKIIIDKIQCNRYVECGFNAATHEIECIRYPEVVPGNSKINFSVDVIREDNTITANVKINYIVDDCNVIMGLYNGTDCLLGCSMKAAKKTDGELELLVNNIENDIKDTYIKLFFWDFEKLIPFCPAQKLLVPNSKYGYTGETEVQYNAKVNRGIGKVEVYLIDNDDPSKDYVGEVKSFCRRSSSEEYIIDNEIYFDQYRVNRDFSSYDALKFVFTPFDGEHYYNTDTAVALGEYYNEDVCNWTGNCQIENGKLIVTYPFNTTSMPASYATANISLNGNEQVFEIDWDGDGNGVKLEYIDCETWAEVITALQEVSLGKWYVIDCSDSSAIVMSDSVAIPSNVEIYFKNSPSFAVENGATLKLDCGASIELRDGDFMVENGGAVILDYVGEDKEADFYSSIRAANIKFESGSFLTILEYAELDLDNKFGDDESVIIFEKGSIVNSLGHLSIDGFGEANLNGTINLVAETQVSCNKININSQISSLAYFTLDGEVFIGEDGAIVVDNTSKYKRQMLTILGQLKNKGKIEIKGTIGASADLYGDVVENYNEGTISVGSNCSLILKGGKYINTGAITGDGIIKAEIGYTRAKYDDGIEYVKVEDDEYWDKNLKEYVYRLSDYSRNKYTHDPATTVVVKLYFPKIINMVEGYCELSIETEDFRDFLQK